MIAKRIPLSKTMRRAFTSISGLLAELTSGIWLPLAAFLLCLAASPRAVAQSAKLAEDPPPPPVESENEPASAASPIAPTIAGPEPSSAEPVFDPLRAEKSIEVGNFYLKKGNYDAAIDRFEEAARLQPKLAKPYLLLGEVYEKKRDPFGAITAYRKYLELYRTAPDRNKVLRRIEKLQKQNRP